MKDWLSKRAHISPDKTAVIVGDKHWSFSELNNQAIELARQLAACGINSKDRVAVLMYNSLDFVRVIYALNKLGAILVPLNTRLITSELNFQLQDVEASLLIYDQQTEELGTKLNLEEKVKITELPDSKAKISLQQQHQKSDIHSIIYTSGTTGNPKGALLTYGNYWSSAMGSLLNLGLYDDDCWLACLPLFHVGGLSILIRSVIYGIPMMLHSSFEPEIINQAIDAGKVSHISLVSNMLLRMLNQRNDRPYPETLRCLLVGGGPVPEDLLRRCAQIKAPVVQTYGLTETTSQVATLAPEEALDKLGSAGKPLFPTELYIADQKGQQVASGTVGEIIVRGPTITQGYFNKPEATATAIQDGWLHTGDLGYLDDEGYLYVVDRLHDLIISGGENIYPAEVEDVLTNHPAVEAAGVVGEADEQWGHVPVAYVKAEAEVEQEELISFCREHLAGYKVPKSIYFVPQLPRNATGKLMRRKLADMTITNN
ncbi:o-succinylbenzoate--CoA ligase [Natroniella sulfidigena]|uniref:o-succinylbenzoate--CoA ligase n=1 Tax=Natroniella sulfidigena TaxID=723921 RepID=UPI00200A3EC3|nr:o-succinylbenzoate--CoA ligase [Natroniella sulfidigena]MCK8817884.1 o-succinylbenzoate--CoA ligase [Natroniella sulfidigena]